MLLVAAGVTYYLLLALVPALTVFVSLYGLVADRASINAHVSLLSGIVPQGGIAIITDQLGRLAVTGRGTLNLTLAISLLVALWSSGAGIRALFKAMNIAREQQETRPLVAVHALALAFALATAIAALVFLTVVVGMPLALDVLHLRTGEDRLVRIASYALMAIVVATGIAALYRWGPSPSKSGRRTLLPGLLVAVLGILLVSLVFSWYTASFSHYDATYGSLGALIGFLTWVWLVVTMLLVGAELNAVLNGAGTRQDSVADVGRAAGVAPGSGRAWHARRAPRRRADMVATATAVIPALLILFFVLRRRR